MRLHWKKGLMMSKDGHHHLKRKHLFKRIMLHSILNKDNLPCKKKHLKHSMRGPSSMLAPEHHGKWKHFRSHSSSSSDSDDSDRHHGKGKHFKGKRWCLSNLDDSHHGKGCMSGIKKSHHHGKEKHFKSMSCSDEGMQGRCTSDNEGGHHRRRMHFMGMHMRGHHGKGKHFKGMKNQSMSCCDGEGMQRCCMTDNEEGGHHHGRMHFLGGHGRPMKGHHGKGKHYKGLQGRSNSSSDDEVMQHCMSDNEGHRKRMHFMDRHGRPMTDTEEGCHGRGKHFKDIMHHHKGKHWMKGHGRRGFFADDSALVPICATEVEDCPETWERENIANQATEAAEVVDEDTARTKNQETQTSGLMEIVIEDQEAQSAAIRIVNKFL